MTDLKNALFEEALYNYNQYMRLKEELGEWDYLVDIKHAKFSSCYTVIENSGLENEYQAWKAQKTKQEEKAPTEFSIYQIDPDRDIERVCFLKYDSLEKFQNSKDVNASIYNKVYEGKMEVASLDAIYERFNTNHPADYIGRSLSVSDVVEIKRSNRIDPGFYFVDSIGFKKIVFDKTLCKQTQPKPELLGLYRQEEDKSMNDKEVIDVIYDLTDKLAKLEDEHSVPQEERLTKWFGDYGMNVPKGSSDLETINTMRKRIEELSTIQYQPNIELLGLYRRPNDNTEYMHYSVTNEKGIRKDCITNGVYVWSDGKNAERIAMLEKVNTIDTQKMESLLNKYQPDKAAFVVLDEAKALCQSAVQPKPHIKH